MTFSLKVHTANTTCFLLLTVLPCLQVAPFRVYLHKQPNFMNSFMNSYDPSDGEPLKNQISALHWGQSHCRHCPHCSRLAGSVQASHTAAWKLSFSSNLSQQVYLSLLSQLCSGLRAPPKKAFLFQAPNSLQQQPQHSAPNRSSQGPSPWSEDTSFIMPLMGRMKGTEVFPERTN